MHLLIHIPGFRLIIIAPPPRQNYVQLILARLPLRTHYLTEMAMSPLLPRINGEPDIPVLGRDRFDFPPYFHKGDVGSPQGVEAGSRLLRELLSEESENSITPILYDIDNRNHQPGTEEIECANFLFSMIELSLAGGKSKFRSQQSFDATSPPLSINTLLSHCESPQDLPSIWKGISSQFLVIDDPEGEIPSTEKWQSCLRDCRSPYVFYSTRSAKNISQATNQTPGIFSRIRNPDLRYLGIIIDVDDLRENGISITPHSSWEKIAADVVKLFKPVLIPREAPGESAVTVQWIIRIGSSGAVVLRQAPSLNQLYFDLENGAAVITTPYSAPHSPLQAAFTSEFIFSIRSEINHHTHRALADLDLRGPIAKGLSNVRSLVKKEFPASERLEYQYVKHPDFEFEMERAQEIGCTEIPSTPEKCDTWSILEQCLERRPPLHAVWEMKSSTLLKVS